MRVWRIRFQDVERVLHICGRAHGARQHLPRQRDQRVDERPRQASVGERRGLRRRRHHLPQERDEQLLRAGPVVGFPLAREHVERLEEELAHGLRAGQLGRAHRVHEKLEREDHAAVPEVDRAPQLRLEGRAEGPHDLLHLGHGELARDELARLLEPAPRPSVRVDVLRDPRGDPEALDEVYGGQELREKPRRGRGEDLGRLATRIGLPADERAREVLEDAGGRLVQRLGEGDQRVVRRVCPAETVPGVVQLLEQRAGLVDHALVEGVKALRVQVQVVILARVQRALDAVRGGPRLLDILVDEPRDLGGAFVRTGLRLQVDVDEGLNDSGRGVLDGLVLDHLLHSDDGHARATRGKYGVLDLGLGRIAVAVLLELAEVDERAADGLAFGEPLPFSLDREDELERGVDARPRTFLAVVVGEDAVLGAGLEHARDASAEVAHGGFAVLVFPRKELLRPDIVHPLLGSAPGLVRVLLETRPNLVRTSAEDTPNPLEEWAFRLDTEWKRSR
ncbi:hypothetical protein OF83DRAFT_559798 [Amylostereum chailletii]|nr:hypothetical protein OF83DRAFT_559798 [Amylostereum chailletii]